MKEKFNLTLEQNIFLAKKILVGSIYSAAKIEGVNTTFPETQTILDGVNVPSVKLDDITVILNLRDAWRFVLDNIEKAKIDLDFIAKINENVARNQSLEWGKLRSGEVGIAGTKHRPSVPNEKETREKIDEIINADKSTTERAIDLMLYIMNNQLFWDGNKRTATLAANAILIKGGAGILQVAEENISEFNRLLTDFYNTQDGVKLRRFLSEKCIVGLSK